MAKHVNCKIQQTIWEKSKPGRYDSTLATCSICNHSTSSHGSGEKSIKRCLTLLNKTCRMGVNHFYVADMVTEYRRYGNNTSVNMYKYEDRVDDEKSKTPYSSAKTAKDNNCSTETETVYVRAVGKDNKYSRPIIVERPVNQSRLPDKFPLLIIENAFDSGDIIVNSELNIYNECRTGFLNDALRGFRIDHKDGYCILAEEVEDELGKLYGYADEILKSKKEKTIITVNHLNACIQHYRNKVEWWEIIYSLEGWAEHFATNEYNAAVADYAPQIIVKLEMLKENINYGIKIFEADIDCLINMHGLNIEDAKSDPKIKPLLKQFQYKN